MIEHYIWEGDGQDDAIHTIHLFELLIKLQILKAKMQVYQHWTEETSLQLDYLDQDRQTQIQAHQVAP